MKDIKRGEKTQQDEVISLQNEINFILNNIKNRKYRKIFTKSANVYGTIIIIPLQLLLTSSHFSLMITTCVSCSVGF